MAKTGARLVILGTFSLLTGVGIFDVALAAPPPPYTGVGEVRLWDLSAGRDSTTLLKLERDRKRTEMLAVAFSPDGSRLAAGGEDGLLRVWDVRTRKETALSATGRVESLVFLPGAKLAGAGEGALSIWDLDTGKENSISIGWTGRMALAADGQSAVGGNRALASEGPNAVVVWDAAIGKQRAEFRHLRLVRSVALSRDGRLAAAAGIDINKLGKDKWDVTVIVWDIETRRELANFKACDPLAFSPDGKSLAVSAGRELGDVILHELATGEQRAFRGLRSQPASLAFSDDGRRLAAGEGNGAHRIVVWDVATGARTASLEGHTAPVLGLAFSPNGKQLASVAGAMRMAK